MPATTRCKSCDRAGSVIWMKWLGWIDLGKPVQVFWCPMCDRAKDRG